jgi:short-subunit dehydrogenase
LVVDYVISQKLPINILVNNAGYGIWGKFEKADIVHTQEMMQVNMMIPVILTHHLLPILQKSSASYILNVASTAAYQAVPTLSVYAASKAFVVLFSRGLRKELAGTSTSVTCLSPGTTDTNFMHAAGMDNPSLIKKAKKVSMSAESVAKFAVKGMFNKKAEIIPGWLNKISVALTYFVPKTLTEKIAGDLYKAENRG